MLKVAATVVAFQKAHPDVSVSKNLLELNDCLERLKRNTESNGVKSTCEKIENEIDNCMTEMKQATGCGSQENASESTKKKKKKKGKKKK